jgi:hypothetical protein
LGSLLHEYRGGVLLAVEVSEVHAYPLRPGGFEEPLFATVSSKRGVIDHLLEAPWLIRASELKGGTGEAAHALSEPVELKSLGNQMEVVRPKASKRCSWKRRRIVRVLDRWREVWGWWDKNRHIDRLVFRILLSGGTVVDLARERAGGWYFVGVVD